MNHELRRKEERVHLGFWIYLMSDCLIFAALFATYAVLRSATFGTPEPKELFSLSFVLVETVILLTSSFTTGLTLLALQARKKALIILGLSVTGLLGATFLLMECYEFSKLIEEGAGPTMSVSLSAFFTLVGTHGLHVFIGLLWLIVLIILITTRGLTESGARKVSCFALFWHFLDVIWIFIFTFVYLFALL
jgi:cytochrome o ubiquinol oxidase subunit 3